MPEAAERKAYFPQVLPADLIAGLGRERFLQGREKMDPVVAARAARGLEVKAAEYIQLIRRQRQLVAIIEDRMAGLDAWIGPTALMLPMPVASLDDELHLAATITQNTQLGNLFDLCGTSSPIQGAALPVGLQVLCRRCQDAAALCLLLVDGVLRGLARDGPQGSEAKAAGNHRRSLHVHQSRARERTYQQGHRQCDETRHACPSVTTCHVVVPPGRA